MFEFVFFTSGIRSRLTLKKPMAVWDALQSWQHFFLDMFVLLSDNVSSPVSLSADF